jgi:cobalt-zinc-cadmium efflux system outer membrane protein
MKKPYLLLLILFCLCIAQRVTAQDTLRLTLKQADSLLLINNLTLITANYQIDIAKAQVLQAKLFNNPELYSEWNLYNGDKRQAFDVGGNGQKIFTITQTLRIAGQRKKEIELATINTRITEQQYIDILRAIKYQLRKSFFAMYYINQALSTISSQLNLLEETVQMMKNQYEKGNVSLKDYTRVRATFFALYNDRSNLVQEHYQHANVVQTLLATEQRIKVEPTTQELAIYTTDNLLLANLQELALENRADVKIANEQVQSAVINHSLQKKMAVPDLRVGIVYDQSGSYISNYAGVSVASTLPFFNRNQGNIKQAEIQIKQADNELKYKKLAIKNEVYNAYNQLLNIETEYKKVSSSFESQLDIMTDKLIENYKKGNLTLIEFTDLFEAYNNSLIAINQLKARRMALFEELNYLTGTELFK